MVDRIFRWVASMRTEDYATAWALCEQDLRERKAVRRDDPATPYHLRWVWDGRPFKDRHCLVRCYHGLGDTIQFARFLPVLAGQAASVTVEVQPRLRELLARGAAGDERATIRFLPFNEADPLPPAECDLEITELAFALRATPADSAVPYLTAPSAMLPRPTVGLCYGAGDWDHARSISAALFAPLCAKARCITLTPEPTTLDVLNPGGCPYDMNATASLVAATDLVITVDTMIAHLAGAMGKPTWLLLKADPDWRWPIGARRTSWYPSIRIYAQPHPDEWLPVLTEVQRDLAMIDRMRAEG